ncbi:MAG TPA: hypothetical protein VK468_05305 [Pyrinomonadaceae bacterium]|nr:hypothetical protein [Pyrinomonadaceae bacterium]
MQWTFRRSLDPEYFRITSNGTFFVADLEKLLDELPNAPDWSSGLPILFDNRNLNMGSGEHNEMREASVVLANHIDLFGTHKIASLMGSHDDFARSRQIISMAEPHTKTVVHAFYDEHEALAWLLGSNYLASLSFGPDEVS